MLDSIYIKERQYSIKKMKFNLIFVKDCKIIYIYGRQLTTGWEALKFFDISHIYLCFVFFLSEAGYVYNVASHSYQSMLVW